MNSWKLSGNNRCCLYSMRILGFWDNDHCRIKTDENHWKMKFIIILNNNFCDGKALKNVWALVYLGAKFSADGDPTTDVKARITYNSFKDRGKKRWDMSGSLNDSFGSPDLSSAWSPRILGYHNHHHQFQSNDYEHLHLHQPDQTLPLTPIHVNDMMSYLEYLRVIRES